MEMIAAAEAARPVDAGLVDGLVVGVGLIGQNPSVELGAAQLAFAGGNVSGAYTAARSARDAWRYAADAGRWRIVSVVLFGLSLVVFVGFVRRPRIRSSIEPA
jgi:hypothetical protein